MAVMSSKNGQLISISFFLSRSWGRSTPSANRAFIRTTPRRRGPSVGGLIAGEEARPAGRIAQQHLGHHVLHDGRGRARSAAAMLDDAGRGIARRAHRCVGNEQRVRLAFPALEEALVLRADHLGRAGLAGHLHVGNGERRAHGRAALFIYHGNHAGADELRCTGSIFSRAGSGSLPALAIRCGETALPVAMRAVMTAS